MDQRRTQRYKLQLPLHIVQVGDEAVNRIERTRDISSGGVCFVSSKKVSVGGRIEYVITLSGGSVPVRIRCLGMVLRSQHPFRRSPDNPLQAATHEVAVTMERYSFLRENVSETLCDLTSPELTVSP